MVGVTVTGPLDDLMTTLRTSGTDVQRSYLSPRQHHQLGGTATLVLCTPLSGSGVLTGMGDGQPPVTLRRGDTAIVQGRDAFRFTATESTVLLTVTYQVVGHLSRHLTQALPLSIVLPFEQDCADTQSYFQVLATDQPIAVDRVMEGLLVCTLTHWIDSSTPQSTGWFGALSDPVVGAALQAIHREPASQWTLRRLAVEAGASRTTLTKRFTDLVGAPPIAYLTQWRMALAAEQLTRTDDTIASVAQHVGYSDAFSFSAAFKRERGVTPSSHRASVA